MNFSPEVITLFNDALHLLWLNFQVPHAVSNMAKDAKRVYPHAVNLMETVRTYGQVQELVESNKGIEWMVAEYGNGSQRMTSAKVGRHLCLCLDVADNGLATNRHEYSLGLLRRPVRYFEIRP